MTNQTQMKTWINSLNLIQKIPENLSWMQCVRSFITRKLLNIEIGRSSGLLHPRCLPILSDSDLEIRGHFRSLQQRCLLRIFTWFPFHSYLQNGGTSTKFEGKYTEVFWINKYYWRFFVTYHKGGTFLTKDSARLINKPSKRVSCIKTPVLVHLWIEISKKNR